MFAALKVRKRTWLVLLGLAVLLAVLAALPKPRAVRTAGTESGGDFLKWVDFTVTREALEDALELDISTWKDPDCPHLGWVDSLAFLGTKYGGDFSRYRKKDLTGLAEKAACGDSPAELAGSEKYFSYYREAYGAVLDGLVGEYELETESGWETRYGLKGFSPIARTFPYSDYDDFGTGRSYGYKRKHLGHDMMAAVGTPVVAVESGVVEALGWNQYGGWRVGIRSFDGKRYHYYAHLRQNRPYAQGLAVGNTVMAGEVIGYVGRTGYSTTENTNNINVSHLHYGLQLIFDESQKEGNNEIWIDVYALCNLLAGHRSEVKRDDATKEWSRAQGFRETVPEDRFFPAPQAESAPE